MRKKNSTAEFKSERSLLLLKNFRESIARQSVISIKRAFEDAAQAPAPRFWVSEVRALRIIRMMLAGEDPLAGMNPEKQSMYMEIYSRVRARLDAGVTEPLGDIVFEVVNSDAPRSFLAWRSAKQVIENLKRDQKAGRRL